MSWTRDPDKTDEENNKMFGEAVKHAHEEAAKDVYEAAIRNGASEEEARKTAVNVKVSL